MLWLVQIYKCGKRAKTVKINATCGANDDLNRSATPSVLLNILPE